MQYRANPRNLFYLYSSHAATFCLAYAAPARQHELQIIQIRNSSVLKDLHHLVEVEDLSGVRKTIKTSLEERRHSEYIITPFGPHLRLEGKMTWN